MLANCILGHSKYGRGRSACARRCAVHQGAERLSASGPDTLDALVLSKRASACTAPHVMSAAPEEAIAEHAPPVFFKLLAVAEPGLRPVLVIQ